MIRLVIFAIGIFIIWVLFASGFNKQRKIIVALTAVTVLVAGIFLESWGKNPRSNIVQVDQLEVCGITATPTYRSNFDFEICLINSAPEGVVKRIAFVLSAAECSGSGACRELENLTRDIPVEIPAGEKAVIKQNLAFGKVSSENQAVQWTVVPVSVKATRK